MTAESVIADVGDRLGPLAGLVVRSAERLCRICLFIFRRIFLFGTPSLKYV
jgi:hypothetical protein